MIFLPAAAADVNSDYFFHTLERCVCLKSNCELSTDVHGRRL